VVNIDRGTLELLKNAKEEDLYISEISPLGISFNNVRGNSMDTEKEDRVRKGKPGSPCTKRFAAINREFTEKSLCTASRSYQKLKIRELDALGLNGEEYSKRYNAIVEKACICVGLGTSALLNHGLDTRLEGTTVAVCPGPNIAYFSEEVSLKEMADHIYGRINIIGRNDRPNLFVKEAQLYLEYLTSKMSEASDTLTDKQKAYFDEFAGNLKNGIAYYRALASSIEDSYGEIKRGLNQELDRLDAKIRSLFPSFTPA
jgi:hypothetical protein